ncbi:MAG TPA: endolytic transglycosylase MltG [Gemmatimonadales bacterium]|nr:endolytic transglycosylase MltG [Gemmatimonadales bacterium]
MRASAASLPRPLRLPALALALLLGACGSNTAPERVTVPPGTSFSAVTDSLAAHGVVSNRLWFTLLARVRRTDRSVRAGVYEFAPGLSAWKVLGILESGSEVATRFTVPEGLIIPEVAALAQEKLGIPADSFVAAARDSAAASATLGFPARSFEGFLRPETYSLRYGTTAAELVGVMARGFLAAWKPEWDARLASLGWSRAQAVTFASIVEGEARADDERETIAGVYHNRLRIGMALQADPTVQYAIFLATGKRKPRLFTRDYQFRSPYNTYLHPGLPPGPVNSPGLRSLEASLYPAKVPYLYFVAGPDGRHVFSRTYSEHLRAIARVRSRGAGAGTSP